MKINGLEIKSMPCGESAMETHGNAFPQESRDAVDNSDAVLFGASIFIILFIIKKYIRSIPLLV